MAKSSAVSNPIDKLSRGPYFTRSFRVKALHNSVTDLSDILIRSELSDYSNSSTYESLPSSAQNSNASINLHLSLSPSSLSSESSMFISQTGILCASLPSRVHFHRPRVATNNSDQNHVNVSIFLESPFHKRIILTIPTYNTTEQSILVCTK
ncbi:hypothetical protein MN116_008994 [Schistosoma mekongi]|uniref:Uncharacterized protein n=1 Tax=Schistosoma mekongi TaxID=38744 RepID=A0AAE1Z4N8_SCHME|nr:hypothetical protein MN116_008994 [Schistosoma mekongi]